MSSKSRISEDGQQGQQNAKSTEESAKPKRKHKHPEAIGIVWPYWLSLMDLTAADTLVYLRLASFKKAAYLSDDAIAEWTGLTPRAVLRSRLRLRERGLLEWDETPGKVNQYRVQKEAPENLDDHRQIVSGDHRQIVSGGGAEPPTKSQTHHRQIVTTPPTNCRTSNRSSSRSGVVETHSLASLVRSSSLSEELVVGSSTSKDLTPANATTTIASITRSDVPPYGQEERLRRRCEGEDNQGHADTLRVKTTSVPSSPSSSSSSADADLEKTPLPSSKVSLSANDDFDDAFDTDPRLEEELLGLIEEYIPGATPANLEMVRRVIPDGIVRCSVIQAVLDAIARSPEPPRTLQWFVTTVANYFQERHLPRRHPQRERRKTRTEEMIDSL